MLVFPLIKKWEGLKRGLGTDDRGGQGSFGEGCHSFETI
jgi:hypothetical protein